MKKSALLAMAAGVSFGLAGGPLRAAPSIPAFYENAAKIKPDGELGQIVSEAEIATPVAGARAWRIAYVSSDVAGRKTLSTGLVVAPAGAPPAGGRPIMAWAHGTTGSAQNCGPSQVTNPAQDLNEYFLMDGDSWTDYGLPGLRALIDEGYVVVGTDYQGLGGGGRHQYAVAATQARDVIDSIRAVRSMKAAGAGGKAIVYGWSQGGGATLAAASLPDYIAKAGPASEPVEVVGFVGLAPFDLAGMAAGKALDPSAADKAMGGLAAGFSDNIFNFTHFAMAIWGTRAAFPELDLNDVFTDEGVRALDRVFSNKCMHAGADTLNYAYGAQFRSLLNPAVRNAEAWIRALVRGSVAPVKPVAPVVIYWGTKDTVVPPVMGKLYQEQMCKLGGNVERVQLPGEQTHFSTPGAAAPLFLPWVKDRFAGKPAANGCPAN
ncbi:alpha/beta fold hydrolase [uncultured Rhodoblastus sp.]|uniref:alpha/beta fold hydrolase n=1 Tax=uncultured Rhodoblastus sp. TaxID=543037 RepID=UPI0025D9E530|nr:alpha/beta fold hydrolase [uncultured Rhodoblastus sp.]